VSPAQRRCPRCDARMAAEQDWCLECGAAATTRIVAPPDWRLAVAVVVAVVAAAAVAVAIVVSSLGGDSNDAVTGAPAATQATTPAAKHRPTTRRRAGTAPVATTATAATTATSSTVPGTATAGAQSVPLWPGAKQAYTIVALTTPDRRAAEQRARQLIAKGRDAGILRSDKYDFFSPGAWVVYVGQFKDKPAAQAELPKLSGDAPSGYVTFIRSRH
jgi:SPOR domain